MIVKPGLLIVIPSCCCAESGPPDAPDESVTFTVNVEAPEAVGVPEMVPRLLKDRLAGSDPVTTVQLSVPAPPVAASAWVYAVPTVPLGNEVVVMLGNGVTTTVDEADIAESETEVAFTETVRFELTDAGAL